MKTIILFAGKYGTTREIAERIAKKTDGATVYNLKRDSIPDLEEFDCVIIGSSIYVGMIRKEAKAFLSENKDILSRKKTGLFLSGLEASGEKEFFEKNFSPDLLRSAKATAFLGGIFDPQKNSLMERFITKVVAKQSGYINTIDDSKIEGFVKDLKS